MPPASDRKTEPVPPARTPVLVHLALFGLFALTAAASFVPGLRLWGIDHLAYYPIGVRLAALLLAGISFLPPVSLGLYRAAVSAARWWKGRRRLVGPTLLIVGIAATGCLWLCRSSTELLGDGRMVARSFEVIFANPAGVRLQGIADILRFERLYPGAMATYYGAARVASDLLGASPVTGIRMLNCLFGGLVTAFVLLVARRKSVSADAAPWLCVLICFSGAMALFAGYVEFYPPFMFAAFLYVLASFRFLGNARGFTLVVLSFTLAVFMHVQGILLGPSLLYLAWVRLRPSPGRHAARLSFATVMALVLLVVAAGALVPSVRGHYLPAWSTGDGTGVFTPSHLLDVLNEYLLVLPALPVVAAMLLGMTRSAGIADGADAGRTKPAPGPSLAPCFSFGLLMLVPASIYLVLFRTEIGVARDWDLFSMVALGLLPLAYLAVVRALRTSGPGERLSPVVVPTILLTIVLGAAWVGVNASWPRSSARFERLLEFDMTHSGYARENLALLYHDKGDLARATRIMEDAVRLEGNDRHAVRLARFYAEALRFDDAAALARAVVDRAPDFVEARVSLLQILEAQGALEQMYEAAKAGTGRFPGLPSFWYYLGESAAGLGRTEEARECLQRVLALNPGPEVGRRVQSLLSRLPSPEQSGD